MLAGGGVVCARVTTQAEHTTPTTNVEHRRVILRIVAVWTTLWTIKALFDLSS
jgi:hypothetical protein